MNDGVMRHCFIGLDEIADNSFWHFLERKFAHFGSNVIDVCPFVHLKESEY